MHESWNPIKGYLYQEPLKTLNEEILPNISYQPKKEHIFRVFKKPLNEIKVVVLGADPYPTPGNAIGYSFAKPSLSKDPVSLRNIKKEVVESDLAHCNPGNEIDILSWIDQGFFMLNTALTVETGKAGSHLKYWKDFTDKVIQFISINNPCIWVLWGNHAKSFSSKIYKAFNVDKYDRHLLEDLPISPEYNYVMTAPHPAAEAYSGGKAGFFGCDHFYKINKILKLSRKQQIIY